MEAGYSSLAKGRVSFSADQSRPMVAENFVFRNNPPRRMVKRQAFAYLKTVS
jgi:hypothetical protein